LLIALEILANRDASKIWKSSALFPELISLFDSITSYDKLYPDGAHYCLRPNIIGVVISCNFLCWHYLIKSLGDPHYRIEATTLSCWLVKSKELDYSSDSRKENDRVTFYADDTQDRSSDGSVSLVGQIYSGMITAQKSTSSSSSSFLTELNHFPHFLSTSAILPDASLYSISLVSQRLAFS
jgi:hypothetical protein